MSKQLFVIAMFLLVLISILGCSTDTQNVSRNQSGGGDGGSDGDTDTDTDTDSDTDSDADTDTDSDTQLPPGIATLNGVVYAPEGTIPISDALVYLTKTQPDPIPEGAYCDMCVEIDSSTPHIFTQADGSFSMPAYSTGDYMLVVRKGQFRRIRNFTVAKGEQDIPKEMTTLPGAMDKAAGDDIPKMLIILGAWDAIEESLTKLGIGKLKKTLLSTTHTEIDVVTSLNALSNIDKLSQYHIVFVPCADTSSGDDMTECNPYKAGQANVKNALKEYVEMGGKLYVTDYSYEYVRQTFPDTVSWAGQSNNLGSACQSSDYTVPANVVDDGLAKWLTAIGETNFDLEANWTTVNDVLPYPGEDEAGNPIMVTPTVWVEALKSDGAHPATISFPRGCGRALFSTYHTEGTSSGMLAQEKALLYILLEVGVCVDDVVIVV
jgi:hypothetical protein